MLNEHYLFLVLGIAPKSRAKVCSQWRMSLSPLVACAADRSKAVILVYFLLHKNVRFQLCVVCFCCGSFNLFYCINLLVVGYNFI